MTGEQLDQRWQQQCLRKHSFATYARAERAAQSAARFYGKPFRVYKCSLCPGYHTTSQPPQVRAA